MDITTITKIEETTAENKEVTAMEERMVKANELATLIDTSVQTITVWYKWKEENPEHELAKLLPEYTRMKGGRRTRFWKESDVEKVREFKNSITQGRGGFMGNVTQRYVIKEKDGKRYIQAAVNILKRNNVDPETVEIIREFLDEEFENRRAA